MKKEIEVPKEVEIEEYIIKKTKEIREKELDLKLELENSNVMRGGAKETPPYIYLKTMLDNIFKPKIAATETTETTGEAVEEEKGGVLDMITSLFNKPAAKPTAPEPAPEPAAAAEETKETNVEGEPIPEEPAATEEKESSVGEPTTEQPAATEEKEPSVGEPTTEQPITEETKEPSVGEPTPDTETQVGERKLILTSNEEIIPLEEIIKKRNERIQRLDESQERYKYEEIPEESEMGKTYKIGKKTINIGFEKNEINIEKSQYEGTKKWYKTNTMV